MYVLSALFENKQKGQINCWTRFQAHGSLSSGRWDSNNFWSDIHLALDLEGDSSAGEKNADFSLCLQFISKCPVFGILLAWHLFYFPNIGKAGSKFPVGKEKAERFDLSFLIYSSVCHFLKIDLCVFFSKVFIIRCSKYISA